MFGEFLKWHISQLVAPIEAFFVAPPPGMIIPEIIKETATANSMQPYYLSVTLRNIVVFNSLPIICTYNPSDKCDNYLPIAMAVEVYIIIVTHVHL